VHVGFLDSTAVRLQTHFYTTNARYGVLGLVKIDGLQAQVEMTRLKRPLRHPITIIAMMIDHVGWKQD